MSSSNVVPLTPPSRALREIEVLCPSWSSEPVRMREPTVRDYMRTKDAKDEQERTISLLGTSVLGADGKPVGESAILDAPIAALGQLSFQLSKLLGEAPEEPEAPLI